MQMELNTIIEKIKKEGIGEAESKAADILKQAQAKADKIIAEAEKKKENIIKNAQTDAANLKKNGEEALNQASRDVILALKESITGVFDALIKKEVAQQLSPEVLKEVIVNLIQKFSEEKEAEIEVLLSDKDKKSMESALLNALKGEVKKGLTIKVSPSIEHGFRIGKKGESSYYDFTDEAITESFKTYLNPKIKELLT